MTERPELQEAIAAIKSALVGSQLFHFVEAEPDGIYTVGAHDDDGYINSGLVGWGEKDEKVFFFCFNAAADKQAQMEAIPDGESKCWYTAPNVELFLSFLKGDVRRVQTRFREFIAKQEDST